LPIRAVDLLVREQQLCFRAAAAAEPLRLLYGDRQLHAPAYPEFSRSFAAAQEVPAVAGIGAEQPNPAFTGERDSRTLGQRHPRLVYLLLALGVCLGAGIMLRHERLRI
ncbi:MAG: hypothetical protein INR65_15445, partial [Gluconacetobacter diazotrophicus]|nr:hypothetical protein [Gluconacetobacter diazotrophicus]